MDGKSPARNSEDGRVVEKLGKLFRVEGGTGDEQLEVRPEPGDVLDQPEQDIRVQGPLVGLKY